MHMVIDVGNTETVIGIFPGEELTLSGHWRYATPVQRTPDELGLLVRSFLAEKGSAISDVRRAVLGSVVPRQTELLRRALASIGLEEILLLEGVAGLPIRLEVEEPRTVGADRIANTLASAHLFARDAIVVDFGTATTYDCITSEGVFEGGVIAPGLLAGEEWLAGQTAKLPRVGFLPPERVIGRRTETCLQSGLFYSAVDGVDGIVDRIRREWGRPDAFVVATGGHAAAVASHSRTVEAVDPHLTLVGLELAGRHLAISP